MTDRLVTIGSFADPLKARLIAGHLEAAGILAVVMGEDAAGAFAGFGGDLATVQVAVAEQDVERAREILTTEPPVETRIQTSPSDFDPPEDLEANPVVAARALRASMIALFFPVLGVVIHFYSLWLVLKLTSREEDEHAPYWWKVYLALGINGLGMLCHVMYVMTFRYLFLD